MKVCLHDPAAKLDYAVDWTGWLREGETITASTWNAPDGLTTSLPGHADGIATIWVTGGTIGTSYRLTNHITTSEGREDERSITVVATDR